MPHRSRNCTFDVSERTTRMQRWQLLLNQFDYVIRHIPGSENTVADHLSRCFIIKENLHSKYMNLVKECTNTESSEDKDENYRSRIQGANEKYFLESVHIISEHRGVITLYNIIKGYFYILNFTQKIKEVTETCRTCMRYKVNVKKLKSKHQMTANSVGERSSSDIFGPFSLEEFTEEYENHKGFVLSITDVYSRYSKVRFCYSVTGRTIMDFIEERKTEFPNPKGLISDN